MGNDSLRTLTRPKLVTCFDTIRTAGTPAQAGSVLIDKVQMLNYADDRGWITKNPIRTLRKIDIEVVDAVASRVLYPHEIVLLRDRLVPPIFMLTACMSAIWISMYQLP